MESSERSESESLTKDKTDVKSTEVSSSKKESAPFVDNVAETGIFSALSTIKPITVRNNSQTIDPIAAVNKPEVEIFEP